MKVFKYEIKTYRNSIIIWSCSYLAITLLFMAFYPTFSQDAALLDSILEHYPKELLAAFGMADMVSMSTIEGYMIFVFAFIQLLAAIQSANYGFACLSVEERELTADFLMSKPVSRRNIIISKFSAAVLAITITNLAIGGAVFLSVAIFSEGNAYDHTGIMLLLLSLPLFQLFFLSVGFMVTVLTQKIRSVLSYAIALAFGLYIINALRGIIGGNVLGLITPFHHFEPAYIIEHHAFTLPMAAISLAVTGISLITSYNLYLKRDIHAL